MSITRFALLAYVLLIVVVTLSPFSGWRDLGVPVFDFLLMPWPRYWTVLDLLTNALGYIPLAMLAVYALPGAHRRRLTQGSRASHRAGSPGDDDVDTTVWALTRPLHAEPLKASEPPMTPLQAVASGLPPGASVLAVVLGCMLLSLVLEVLQNFLPNRVASNVDVLSNTLGALAGAWAGVRTAPRVIDNPYLTEWRNRWFIPHVGPGLLLIVLWLIAQAAPQTVWMGFGDWVHPMISIWPPLANIYDTVIDAPMVFEGLCVSFGILASGLLLLQCTRADAPRNALLAVLLLSTLAARTASTVLLGRWDNPFDWLGAGAQGGMVVGLMLLLLTSGLPRSTRRKLAMLSLLALVIVANLSPENAYAEIAASEQLTGPWWRLRGAAEAVALLWPYLAGWWLWRYTLEPGHRRTRRRL